MCHASRKQLPVDLFYFGLRDYLNGIPFKIKAFCIVPGDISVDALSAKVKRAASLIRICKNKLTATEEDVNIILGELEAGDGFRDGQV